MDLWYCNIVKSPNLRRGPNRPRMVTVCQDPWETTLARQVDGVLRECVSNNQLLAKTQVTCHKLDMVNDFFSCHGILALVFSFENVAFWVGSWYPDKPCNMVGFMAVNNLIFRQRSRDPLCKM